MTFNFVGRVTRVPTMTALPMCEVWGEQLYVEGAQHKYSGTMMLENFVPAWNVPLAEKKPKKPQFPMQIEQSMISFDFEYTVGFNKQVQSVPLIINRLVLPDDQLHP